jgi:hypothetical protein
LILSDLETLEKMFGQSAARAAATEDDKAHWQYLIRLLNRFRESPKEFIPVKAPAMPDGAPIGCW